VWRLLILHSTFVSCSWASIISINSNSSGISNSSINSNSIAISKRPRLTEAKMFQIRHLPAQDLGRTTDNGFLSIFVVKNLTKYLFISGRKLYCITLKLAL
jgi:hypothetical protein